MKKIITAAAVLGIAASVVARSDYEDFGGSISVYDVKVKADSLKVQSAKKNLQVNDQKLNANKYSKDSVSVSGQIIVYDGYESILVVDKNGWEQGEASISLGIPSMIETNDMFDTGATKLALEGVVASNELMVVSAQGSMDDYIDFELEDFELDDSGLVTKYKVDLKTKKDVTTEKVSMSATGSGEGYVRNVYGDGEDDYEWFYAGMKQIKVKYNSKASDDWSEVYDSALSTSNEAYAVAAVEYEVNQAIIKKTKLPADEVSFELEYSNDDMYPR
ncbi:hypothetical protein [Pontiella sulfatireligans]|uniref:Uncharacterized protein n=1 Tax=Pontiella sulfatireligans TaxID=2750658 RepID=A0A6C2UJN9_9BACT|nr:hypothetical protein [Pontiella sulfatireligans]VGO20179.1 hypothetical protein SCARR_02240 [Pontiella sulfatireligans]